MLLPADATLSPARTAAAVAFQPIIMEHSCSETSLVRSLRPTASLRFTGEHQQSK